MDVSWQKYSWCVIWTIASFYTSTFPWLIVAKKASISTGSIHQWPWFGIHMQWWTVVSWFWILVSWTNHGRRSVVEVCRLDWKLGQGRWIEPPNGDSFCGGYAWGNSWGRPAVWRPWTQLRNWSLRKLSLMRSRSQDSCRMKRKDADSGGNSQPGWGSLSGDFIASSAMYRGRHDPSASRCEGSFWVHWCRETSQVHSLWGNIP